MFGKNPIPPDFLSEVTEAVNIDNYIGVEPDKQFEFLYNNFFVMEALIKEYREDLIKEVIEQKAFNRRSNSGDLGVRIQVSLGISNPISKPKIAVGDDLTDDVHLVGIISDIEIGAEDALKQKGVHCKIENTLHHACPSGDEKCGSFRRYANGKVYISGGSKIQRKQ